MASGPRALGPLERVGSHFIRAAELLSGPLALLCAWVEPRFAGGSVSVAGQGQGEGRDGVAGSRTPFLLSLVLCSPLPLSVWVPGWAHELPPALLT